MTTVYLGLGSNKGDRAANLRAALAALPPLVRLRNISSLYETAPMYLARQEPFYNIAVQADTDLTPRGLLDLVKDIERQLGRSESVRNGPREIDIDILFFGDLVLDALGLTIPHPGLHERPFVLVPLEEIAPFAMHPLLRRPVIELWEEAGGEAGAVWEAQETL